MALLLGCPAGLLRNAQLCANPQLRCSPLRASNRIARLRTRPAALAVSASAADATVWIANWRKAQASPSLVTRVKSFVGGAKLDKAKLAALGTSALLSYGFVSNVNAVTLLIISWVSFARSTGLSPLAPGQWKAYLLAYTALYAVVGNGLRPIRFSLAVAITPVFDRFVAFLQHRLNLPKAAAFATCVFLVNVCGTFSYLFLGLRLVTGLLGLPLLP